MKFQIRSSKPKDLINVKNLLKRVNLTVEGVEYQFHNFFIAENNNLLLASVGFEIYNKNGLLRSLAVHPDFRNNKIAYYLVFSVIKLAKDHYLDNLYLLTESSKNYFEKFDFTTVKRELTPEDIKKSIEFSKACSETAVIMKLNLKS